MRVKLWMESSLRKISRLEISWQSPSNSNPNAQSPKPNEKLVKVFESEQEPEALVVKGLLDSAGIESDLTSASLVQQDTFPGLGSMILLVREEVTKMLRAKGVIEAGLRSARPAIESANGSTMTRRRRLQLLKTRHDERNRTSVEIERDGAVQISPINARSRF